MAITGSSFREKFDYISDRDTAKSEAEGATVWEIGNIPADLRTSIQDGMMGMVGGDFRMNTSSVHLQAVRYGLKGVRNYKDEKGKVIKFATTEEIRYGLEYQVPTNDFLNTLPNWLVNELGKKILDTNSVSEDERKNSNTQSSQ